MEETKVEEQKRLSNWDNFLITGEEDEKKKAAKTPENKDPTADSAKVDADNAENVAGDVYDDDDEDYFDDADKDETNLIEN